MKRLLALSFLLLSVNASAEMLHGRDQHGRDCSINVLKDSSVFDENAQRRGADSAGYSLYWRVTFADIKVEIPTLFNMSSEELSLKNVRFSNSDLGVYGGNNWHSEGRDDKKNKELLLYFKEKARDAKITGFSVFNKFQETRDKKRIDCRL